MTPRHLRPGVAEFVAYVATMQIQDFRVLDPLASEREGSRAGRYQRGGNHVAGAAVSGAGRRRRRGLARRR
ncbi:MAG: hypothetical protein JOY89_23465 [Solirubrobacterales bacterium]|nr:hypothetical protein [Solirubrobacterales bacterium]